MMASCAPAAWIAGSSARSWMTWSRQWMQPKWRTNTTTAGLSRHSEPSTTGAPAASCTTSGASASARSDMTSAYRTPGGRASARNRAGPGVSSSCMWPHTRTPLIALALTLALFTVARHTRPLVSPDAPAGAAARALVLLGRGDSKLPACGTSSSSRIIRRASATASRTSTAMAASTAGRPRAASMTIARRWRWWGPAARATARSSRSIRPSPCCPDVRCPRDRGRTGSPSSWSAATRRAPCTRRAARCPTRRGGGGSTCEARQVARRLRQPRRRRRARTRVAIGQRAAERRAARARRARGHRRARRRRHRLHARRRGRRQRPPHAHPARQPGRAPERRR